MIKVEKRILNSLTQQESNMMNNGFSICDIVWGRFNSEVLYIKNCDEFNDYYENIIDYADVLDHEKDYQRSAAINIQRAILEVSGLDLVALANHKYRYMLADKLIIYGSPFSILNKYILNKKIKKEDVSKMFHKMEHFFPKTILPFRYLNSDEMVLLTEKLAQKWQVDPYYWGGTLQELMPNHNFAKTEKILIEKGLIKVPPKEQPLPSLDEMMNNPNFK